MKQSRSLLLLRSIPHCGRFGEQAGEERGRTRTPHGGKETEMDKLTPEQIAIKAAEKAEASMVKRKAEIVKNYPHALVDTLTFDEAAGNGGKFKVQIRCVECGNEDRWVYTSDLFQVNRCTACSEAAAKAKKAAKRAEAKASRELAKANAAPVVVQA